MGHRSLYRKPKPPPVHLIRTILTDYCTKPGAVAPRAHPRVPENYIGRANCRACVEAWRKEIETP